MTNIKQMTKIFSIVLMLWSLTSMAQPTQMKMGLLKYAGGGDWYANPTALPNLAMFCNRELNMSLNVQYVEVTPSSSDIFNVPFVHMTGHGNVVFSEREINNLRTYLYSGGFLHIDDNYGMDTYIRRELKKIFPDKDLIELPFTHDIYHRKYSFHKGLPKIHLHDNKPPQGFAIMHEGRVIVFYTYECDLSDGWEDPAVHNDSPQKHEEALQMGANIVEYALHF